MSEDSDTTLFALAAAEDAEMEREALDDNERLGPTGHQFEDLARSVVSAFVRGWVECVTFDNQDGEPHLHYTISDSGIRAVAAYRRRLERAQ